MNLAITYPVKTQAPVMELVRNEERILKIRYLQGLNLVTIKGGSASKDEYCQYENLLLNIQDHFLTSNSLNLYIKYELINDTSLDYLLNIAKAMNQAYSNGKKVQIYWDNFDQMAAPIQSIKKICDFNFEEVNL